MTSKKKPSKITTDERLIKLQEEVIALQIHILDVDTQVRKIDAALKVVTRRLGTEYE